MAGSEYGSMMNISGLDLAATKSLAAQLILTDVINGLSNVLGPGLDKKVASCTERVVGVGHRMAAHDICGSLVVQGISTVALRPLLPEEPIELDTPVSHTNIGRMAGLVIDRHSIFKPDTDLDRKFWQDFITKQGDEQIPYNLPRNWITHLPPVLAELDLNPDRRRKLEDYYLLGGGWVSGQKYFDIIVGHAYQTVFYHILKGTM